MNIVISVLSLFIGVFAIANPPPGIPPDAKRGPIEGYTRYPELNGKTYMYALEGGYGYFTGEDRDSLHACANKMLNVYILDQIKNNSSFTHQRQKETAMHAVDACLDQLSDHYDREIEDSDS